MQYTDVEKPVPGAGEVLVEIHAAALNAYDWHLLRADPFLARSAIGLVKPSVTILGADIAGRVEATGDDVTQFQPGDEVFGDIAAYGAGGLAEYVAVLGSGLVHKPRNLSFEEAAAVPMAALTALNGLSHKGNLKAGKSVLIQGASGGVGTFAVQIAEALGGGVTAVCSTAKIEQTLALGADHVVDYRQEDFVAQGKRYDLILGVNGHRSLGSYRRALKPGGTYIIVGGTNAAIFEALLLGPLFSMLASEAFDTLSFVANQTDLTTVKELIEAGQVSPVIDRRYPLREAPEALRYLEEGDASGKVVIRVKEEKGTVLQSSLESRVRIGRAEG